VSELVLLPIYPAGEKPIPGVTSEGLVEGIRSNGTSSVTMAPDFGHAAKIVRGILRPGDLLLTIGAGDVYRVGELVRGGAS
jgi:UDP-N-acetylmuramate--alanine ligase